MKNKKATQERLPLIFSTVGAVGILPCMILNLVQSDYLGAAFAAILIVALAGIAWYAHRFRNIRASNIMLASVACGATVTIFFHGGTAYIYLVFPTLLGLFFLLKRGEAILTSMLLILAFLSNAIDKIEPLNLAVISVSTLLITAFAYVFTSVTNRERDQLIELAYKDPLTGVGNRRALQQKLAYAITSQGKTKREYSLLMLDLDHFKLLNDQHGHAKGDEILVRLTEIIATRIRATDSIFRIGGEEFLILVADQNLENASHIAEHLRSIVETSELATTRPVTISLGVAQYLNDESAESWVSRADHALYQAKNLGRNCTQRAA